MDGRVCVFVCVCVCVRARARYKDVPPGYVQSASGLSTHAVCVCAVNTTVMQQSITVLRQCAFALVMSTALLLSQHALHQTGTHAHMYVCTDGTQAYLSFLSHLLK